MTIYPAGTQLIRKDGVKFVADGSTDWGNTYSVDGDVSGTPSASVGGASNTQGTYSSGDQPTSYYGNERNRDWEGPHFQQATFAKEAAVDSGIINDQFASELFSDPSIVGFYVNALAYGGYTIGDILNDMKRREMAGNGDDRAKNLKLIDPEVDKKAYQNTAEGQAAYRESASIIPTFTLAGGMNPDILKYGSNMPEELFKTLVPILDKNSQEFKDAVANVKSAFYDMANQQLQANTEQEKAVADYNYEKFKEEIEKQFGIVLSDNAEKAWNQIEELESTASTRGISGSGLEREAIDDVLQSTRKQDQRTRQSKLTQEESQRAAQYTSSATPAQIKALIDEDIAKGLKKEEWRATKWGLVPSDDVLAQYDMASLKQRYPDQSEEELKAYRDSVLDENGNYRSTLYGKYFSEKAKNIQDKKTTAETQVTQDALNKELAAYRNYDKSQPFSVATPQDTAQTEKDAAETPQPPGQTVTTEQDITPEETNEGTSEERANLQKQLDSASAAVEAIKKKRGLGVMPGTSPVTTGSPTRTPSSNQVQVPYTPGYVAPGSTSSSPYTIKSGETLSQIATKNKTTAAELARINKITNPDLIYAGQTIKFQ